MQRKAVHALKVGQETPWGADEHKQFSNLGNDAKFNEKIMTLHIPGVWNETDFFQFLKCEGLDQLTASFVNPTRTKTLV